MQSLMGDRLLKWFLSSSRLRFPRVGLARARSESERSGTESALPDGAGDEQAQISDVARRLVGTRESLVQPQSPSGLQHSLGPAQARDAAASEDSSEGDES